jgi:hypothetical protein
VCQPGTRADPSRRTALVRPPAAAPVTERVRVLYSDLDGTMVGPGGCFFRTADRALTLVPAEALVALHEAGVVLVLVSGRSREQLLEGTRVFGADGFIGELGSVIGWDRGARWEVLRGAMPAGLDGPPAQAIQRAGVVDGLFDRYPGRLEYHAPWHEGHAGDVMLRGLVDGADAEAWLAGAGYGWLRLRDNGVLAHHPGGSLVDAARPPHVYHLMPAGLGKGAAVAADLARRGIPRAEAYAVGDSLSDLDMAGSVQRLFVVANGHAQPHMAAALAATPNLVRTAGAVGLGWAEAARAAAAAGPGR